MHYLSERTKRCCNLALRQAKIEPTVEEKRYITLQFLEAAFMSGSSTTITPVKAYGLTELSGERFVYDQPVETYVIFDERPKPFLLQKLGWYREDAETVPIVAYIATHLLYDKSTDDVVNEVLLDGNEMQLLVKTGESENYILKELKVIRGTLVDIYYDFIDKKDNRFYVADVKTDLVSINYVARLVPFKEDKESEAPEDGNKSNSKYLNIKTEDLGL
jgi:hypothetical protein